MKIHKAVNILLIVVLLLTGFSASPKLTSAQGVVEQEPPIEPTEAPIPEPTIEPGPELTETSNSIEVIIPDDGEIVPEHYIVVLKSDNSVKGNETVIESTLETYGGSIVYFYESKYNGYLAKLPPDALKFVQSNPMVERIEMVALQEGQSLDTEVINENFSIKHTTLDDGTKILVDVINGPSEPPEGYATDSVLINELPDSVTLASFPSYDWVFGCSAVSGAMHAAYYDRNGYPNVYTGPTNGGVMPLTDTSWPTWSDGYQTYPNNPLVASHKGVDGRTIRGSIDDYWVSYGSSAQDPYISGGWTQHTWGTAIGDYMKTSQSAYGNTDGSTMFPVNYSADKYQCSNMPSYAGLLGVQQFYQARGYSVTTCFSQRTDNQYTGGFSLADFQAEINAGRPVLLSLTGHTIIGYGYSGSTIYIRDTWDSNPSNIHTMTWGGSYSGLELRTAHIIRLATTVTTIPTPLSPSGDIYKSYPTFTWTKVPNATWYIYQVMRGSTVVYTKSVSPSVCGTTQCSYEAMWPLTEGSYKWRVKAYVGGWRDYSAWKAFNVIPIPTPLAPTGTVSDNLPTFKWSKTYGASYYIYQVMKGSTVIYTKSVSASVCSTTECAYKAMWSLGDGSYQWRVKAYVGGWKDYSAWKAFNVLTIPSTIAPKGTISENLPTFTWSKINSAGYYIYQVMKGSTVVYTKSVSPSVCGTTQCSYKAMWSLSDGSYSWRVKAYVGGSWKNYSPWASFTILSYSSGFNSQFSGSMTGWARKAGASWQVGSSYMYTYGLSEMYSSAIHTGQYSNFDYSARVKRVGGSDGWTYPAQYLMVRMGTQVLSTNNTWYPGYMFGYADTGRYSIWETNSDGSVSSIQPWTYSSALKPNDWNVLRVVANDSYFYFYINSTLVYVLGDSTRSAGYVGFQMFKLYGINTQFQVDWATLGVVDTAELVDTISPEQAALNQASLEMGVIGSHVEDIID